MTETPRDAATANETAPDVIVLVRDLMFSSRIAAAARAADVPLTLLRDPARLSSAPTPPTPAARLIVDLKLPGGIDAAARWKQCSPGRQVIGFVSHVDADTIARARAAGIDPVLPRSRFVEILPDLLTSPRP